MRRRRPDTKTSSGLLAPTISRRGITRRGCAILTWQALRVFPATTISARVQLPKVCRMKVDSAAKLSYIFFFTLNLIELTGLPGEPSLRRKPLDLITRWKFAMWPERWRVRDVI